MKRIKNYNLHIKNSRGEIKSFIFSFKQHCTKSKFCAIWHRGKTKETLFRVPPANIVISSLIAIVLTLYSIFLHIKITLHIYLCNNLSSLNILLI